MKIIKFYNETEFKTIYQRLKLYNCPFCRKKGFLILHGYVRGYSVIDGNKIIKGHRIYCSNRNKRRGCGHTWSIYINRYIPKFQIDTKTLSIVLNCHNNRFKGWKENHTGISISSFYRIIDKFNRKLLTIRTYLSNRYKPPISSLTPLRLTLKHISNLNKNLQSALNTYQQTFQVPIIG